MPQKQVIAAVIERSGKFLLGKRSLAKRVGPGHWCPITGRIEINETEAQAVVREVFEETSLLVNALVKVGSHETRDKSAIIHWWRVKIIAGEAKLNNDENLELRWVSMEEMRVLTPMFEEDIAVFENLD